MALPPITVTPYTPISNQVYNDEVTIKVTKAAFNNVPFQEGKLVITFISCLFRKVIIENIDEIDFPDISLAFMECFIECIQVDDVATKNISILCSRSVVAGRIASPHIPSVDLSDCILRDSIFIIDVQKVRISFQESQLAPDRWSGLSAKVKKFTITEASTAKQSYHIHKATSIHFSSNFKKDRSREMQDLHLALTYSLDVEDKKTQIENVYLDSLSVTGSPSGRISVENVRVENWYVYNFSPKGEATFFDIRPKSDTGETKIGIHKCNLDNTRFDNVLFDRYKIVSFYLTKFSKAVFTSCDLPDNYEQFKRFMPIDNVHYPEDKHENYAKDVYEIMLQLKMALEGTGNYFEAQKLQAVAHDALKEVKGIPKQDRIILCVNNWSNGHGLSIKKPFWWLIGSSVFLYILYLLSLGRIFNSNEFDSSLIGYYFAFLDLTHRTDFLVDKTEYNMFSLGVDYIGKVVVGFFIYQFISSFRKYGKK